MTPIPDDPGDIDLEAIKAQTPGCGGTRDLIAAVEALRVRVVRLEVERDLAVAHDSQSYPTAAAYEVVCKARATWQRRANAAETRATELEEAYAANIRYRRYVAGDYYGSGDVDTALAKLDTLGKEESS